MIQRNQTAVIFFLGTIFLIIATPLTWLLWGYDRVTDTHVSNRTLTNKAFVHNTKPETGTHTLARTLRGSYRQENRSGLVLKSRNEKALFEPWVKYIETKSNSEYPSQSIAWQPLIQRSTALNNIREDPDWQKLSQEVCPLNFSQIVEYQLGPWLTSGFQRSQLNSLYCQRKHVARITYVNGTLRFGSWQLGMDQNRLRSALWFIHLAVERARDRGEPIPSFELILNPTDKTSNFGIGGTSLLNKPYPLFCNAKCNGDHSISFPIMYNSAFGTNPGEMSIPIYKEKYKQLVALGSPTPWKYKNPKLFFSSSNTRGHRASILNQDHTDIVALSQNVPLSEYGKYRYLLYAYGHSGWSQRLRELAFMNAVILLEASNCNEYFQQLYTPWVDYIPVSEDLSNVAQRLEEAQSLKGDDMASRWRSKGYVVFSLPCVLRYVESILRTYSRLQRFDPIVHTSDRTYSINQSLLDFTRNESPPSHRECFA
eukprot:gene5449-8901_t